MILDELNPRQREAAERTEGALVVLAGAGSGKTKTLTARAANIVDSLDVWPGNILCITDVYKRQAYGASDGARCAGGEAKQTGTWEAVS